MKFDFVHMDMNYLNQIKNWKYSGFVKNIYVEPYFNSHDPKTGMMKGPGGCEGFAVLNQNKLVGMFEYYFYHNIMEIGLALSPELVGKGLGKDFVEQGINFGKNKFNYNQSYIRLTVNKHNKPAKIVYKKAGFVEYNREKNDIEMRMYFK